MRCQRHALCAGYGRRRVALLPLSLRSGAFVPSGSWSHRARHVAPPCMLAIARRCSSGESTSLSRVHSRASWRALPAAERQAWAVLGWTEESWDGLKHPPLSELKMWEDLSSQEKAAAMYGLGYTPESWDVEESATDFLVATPSKEFAASASTSTSSSSSALPAARNTGSGTEGPDAAGAMLRMIPWLKAAVDVGVKSLPRSKQGVGQMAASVLNSAFDAAVDAAGPEDAVAVTGVEDVIYLDDSGSMQGSELSMAQDLWWKMAERLQENPTRILKFGSKKHLVSPRTTTFSRQAVAINWNASSGTTYMWHMILEDVLSTYRPGPGRIRAFVITDGGDTDSPAPYRGMEGMDPMMQQLREAGYNMEFHIVFVSGVLEQAVHGAAQAASRWFGAGGEGALGAKDLQRYRDLANATGGGFLHLTGMELDEEHDAFISHFSADPRDAERHRLEAKRGYERRLAAGGATDFGWYQKLP